MNFKLAYLCLIALFSPAVVYILSKPSQASWWGGFIIASWITLIALFFAEVP